MSKLDYGYNIHALKGMKLEEIQTPCLLIDYETFKLNVEKMRSFTHEMVHHMQNLENHYQ